jgi:hypothetical protein
VVVTLLYPQDVAEASSYVEFSTYNKCHNLESNQNVPFYCLLQYEIESCKGVLFRGDLITERTEGREHQE